jgi:hypothetical protein
MIAEALSHFLPNSQWTLNGDKYEGLTWIDDSPKPTKEQIEEWVLQIPIILQNKKRIAEIQSQLDNIDRQSVRPLRAKLAGTDTQADRERLEELEAEASTLRTELNKLSGDPAPEE